jgi:tyrosine-protein phosphatase YwqE
MFSFFSRKSGSTLGKLDFIGADMHNHLLPGIDDGSPNVETSLKLAEGLLNLGYKKLICTPHVLADVHPNNRQTIEAAYEKLKASAHDIFAQLSLDYAAEFMVDFEFEQMVKERKLLCFGPEKYVLIEMSYAVESANLRNMIFTLLVSGFQPILAHPERYMYFYHKFDEFEKLKDAGCDLQLNLLSLSGYYGVPVKRMAEKLLDRGLISWLGTDMHHERHLDELQKMVRDKKTMRYLNKITQLKNPTLL